MEETNFFGRKLYPEEKIIGDLFYQQVFIKFDYELPEMDLYELNKEYNHYVEGELIKKKVICRSKAFRMSFYGVTEEVALILAKRWVQEPKQKSRNYRVLGIDKYHSIFD